MTLIINPKVTIFQKFNQPVEDIAIEEILQQIQSGKYKEAILKLRKLIPHPNPILKTGEGNLKAYTREKEKLLAFTPSGTFLGGSRREYFKDYSGIIVLDIDHLKIEKVQSLKSQVSSLDFTYACFISPSGLGLKVLVKVDNDWKYHEMAFEEVKTYYEDALGVKIDRSGRNINRLCFFSWGPEIYIRMD